LEKLTNEETEWDHRISATVKEGPADCIRIDEKTAPGLPGLIAEMIQSTRNIEAEWILDLCNGIVKEGCISEHWKSSMVLHLPVFRGKGDPMECGS